LFLVALHAKIQVKKNPKKFITFLLGKKLIQIMLFIKTGSLSEIRIKSGLEIQNPVLIWIRNPKS
jgi:hypothetical protein